MTQFIVVDLSTQAAFLPANVLNPPDGFLRWLLQYGEVGRWVVQKAGRSVEAYAFRSVTGLETSFWFDEQGDLHVDHDDEVIKHIFMRQGLLIPHVFLSMRKKRAVYCGQPSGTYTHSPAGVGARGTHLQRRCEYLS